MFPIKIERAWLRIIVSAIVGGFAGFALFHTGVVFFVSWVGDLYFVAIGACLAGPILATVHLYVVTPSEPKDGHTRCGKCGYILEGLTEPRCSECGERI